MRVMMNWFKYANGGINWTPLVAHTAIFRGPWTLVGRDA
ncbi:hypothetical protein R69749_07484 [Paraburkholderia domus]|uniref:Uncharacterized protein n=1 Tax=Paraburkholderia domus TaxID=2793075 RepID=A0A9N8R3H0_9BURK|nr:hypothetical protein R70006_08105 [Paraburkholderia domus]CAE6888816.1 hypothetical protein R69749_07484 [Paraburkholderia domus]CAE6964149.1 hypothetical protein R70211_07199 [Paraburkholderia domus]CAE6967285.1 hypothetical protein R70199_07829 [Paraburkholderia domus]